MHVSTATAYAPHVQLGLILIIKWEVSRQLLNENLPDINITLLELYLILASFFLKLINSIFLSLSKNWPGMSINLPRNYKLVDFVNWSLKS